MPTKPMHVHGADVSHHQGNLDLAKAKKAGLEWLGHKASEGDNFTDLEYRVRRAAAKKAGLPFGGYHFARAERGDAAAEAKRFLSVATPKPGDVGPCLDLETTEGLSLAALDDWAVAWGKTIRAALGKTCPIGLYTPFHLPKAEEFFTWVWRPRYNDSNTPPVLPYDVWQFSNGVAGVPDSFPGLGHVDLNTHRKGWTTARMLIPEPKAPRKTRRLKMAVLPGQFSDKDADTRKDFATVFARGYDVIFGTEVGPGSGSDGLLEEEAKRAGYRVAHFKRYDTWVGVKASLIKKGTWVQGAEHQIDRSSMHHPDPPGRWGDKALVWAQCEIEGLGVCSFGSVHPLTHGGAGAALKKSTDLDVARVNAAWLKEHGKGKALAWIGGDWNLSDRKNDLTQGLWPGVSCWDEGKEWDNTGHGNIDAILRYVPDTRVLRWVRAEALDDKDLPLATDHFLTEADCLVEELAA